MTYPTEMSSSGGITINLKARGRKLSSSGGSQTMELVQTPIVSDFTEYQPGPGSTRKYREKVTMPREHVPSSSKIITVIDGKATASDAETKKLVSILTGPNASQAVSSARNYSQIEPVAGNSSELGGEEAMEAMDSDIIQEARDLVQNSEDYSTLLQDILNSIQSESPGGSVTPSSRSAAGSSPVRSLTASPARSTLSLSPLKAFNGGMSHGRSAHMGRAKAAGSAVGQVIYTSNSTPKSSPTVAMKDFLGPSSSQSSDINLSQVSFANEILESEAAAADVLGTDLDDIELNEEDYQLWGGTDDDHESVAPHVTVEVVPHVEHFVNTPSLAEPPQTHQCTGNERRHYVLGRATSSDEPHRQSSIAVTLSESTMAQLGDTNGTDLGIEDTTVVVGDDDQMSCDEAAQVPIPESKQSDRGSVTNSADEDTEDDTSSLDQVVQKTPCDKNTKGWMEDHMYF